MKTEFKKPLLDWYRKNSRELPFRGSKDPWKILVSEIMLQQTTMETILNRYPLFIKQFPTVSSLAKSSEQEALKAWEGLGYYRRVKNLRKTALICHKKFNGKLPKKYSELILLPGIGEYTASAISSICHNEKKAAIDGNVTRVISRFFSVKENINKSIGLKKIKKLANQVLNAENPGDHNQAIMDLGSMVCTPKNPKCLSCPLSKHCHGFNSGDATRYPVKNKKNKSPEVDVAIASIKKNGKILLVQRPAGTMLEGLWELPGGKVEKNESIMEACVREIKEETGMSIKVNRKLGMVKHAYTHLKVRLHIFEASIKNQEDDGSRKLIWSNINEIEMLPIPTGTKKALSIIKK